MKLIPTRILLTAAFGLALLAPVAQALAQAVNYNPATTITVYIHGFQASGWNSTWLAGDDSENNDACGMWGDLNTLSGVMGAPTWAVDPTAPNCLCAATYYGSTLPSWYSAQDIADDNALNGTEVPQYALREAKYIRHCLNRAPGATSAHVMSASFGGEITRYLIEHNLQNLCSDGLISRWSSVVGVLRGNWMASEGVNLAGFSIGTIIGVNNANDPDLPDMAYSWVDSNISAHDTMNSAYYGPMVFNEFTADDADGNYITDFNNNANDNMNMNTDEQFAGYTTTAALHPAMDGTLQMPSVAYYPYQHTGVRDDPAMWASLAAAAQSNKRFTITLTRLKALVGGAGLLGGNGQWVYHSQVYSPQSAALYGNTYPFSDLDWHNGVSPEFSLGQGATTYPNTPVFDMIIPPGETQVQLVFSLSQLVNQYDYYDVIGTGSNPTEGQWTLTFSTTNTSTVTVSSGNAEADFSTSIYYVCYQPPALPRQTDRNVAKLTLLTVTNTATDFNPPGDVLSYQLINPPSGAAIDTNGVITWTPTEAQSSTANMITTVVNDGTSSVTNSFIVTVITLPAASVDTNALTTCGTTCISLGGSVGGCATGGVWTTTGAGTFSPNDATVNASYCPSPADYGQAITNTLTSQGPCAPYSDATAQVVVTVITPVTIMCPANVTVNADSGQCYATGVALGTPNTTGTGVSVGNDAPAQFPLGVTTVTWTATDSPCGNQATCAQTVTVIDNQPPSITYPANKTVNSDPGHCYATGVALGTPATSDNCGIATVSNNAPAQYPVGPNIVTWTVTDTSGNTATCAQIVTVLGGVDCYRVVGCTVQDLNLGSPLTADNCSVASVVNDAPAVYPLGTTVVTWTVTDASGNTATVTQRVNVRDLSVPTITGPVNLTVTANDGNTATNVVLGSPVTADNCSVASVVNNGPAAYPLGATVVIWTVTDGSGNTATCPQTVTVVLASVPPGNATISYSGGVITITWDSGVLQQSDDILGPYTDVEGATSPWPVGGSDPQKFYRVRGTGP